MCDSLRSVVLLLFAVPWFSLPVISTATESNTTTNAEAANGAAASTASVASPRVANINPILLDLLVKKGIITGSEADGLRTVSGSAGMQQLLLLLASKGVISDSDVADLKAGGAASEHLLVDNESSAMQTANLTTPAAQTKPPEPSGPAVIPAIAPLRVLPLNPPSKDGLAVSFKLGSGAIIAPYGFIKSTQVYDSLDPTGDDSPRPGFTAADTGPNKNPEWHLKARSIRLGSRFEWPDVSKNVAITGQIEGDFEGNFSRADNRNVSSIRSNAFQLRLAFGRIDWSAAPNTDIFFEAGQDWTIFGSSALMSLFETTLLGAYWGNLYERSPQMRLGFVQKLGGSRDFKLSPEFAIMMPSEGNLPADSVTCTVTALNTPTTCTFVNGLGNQLGYGERQGADAARPELESRVVLQFQLDKAPGVVPAQILWSGFYTRRQATVLASGVPAAYKTAFPDGVDVSSPGYGNQIAVSLPTRWLTVVASGYTGADLRFFFAGETLSNYNQAAGLTAKANGSSVDGSSTVVFGLNAAGHAVTAPQLPVRGYGGFVQVGLPVSRWFNADPKGRNAGWQAYFEYGLDAADINDFRLAKNITVAGAGPYKDTIKAFTIFYKMNPWVQFGFEESQYQGNAYPAISGPDAGQCTTKVAGKPTCTSTDWRSEFGPIFTF